MYKFTYDFHFMLGGCPAMTSSQGFPRIPLAGGPIIIYVGCFRGRDPVLYMGHLLFGMLLLLQGTGHLMSGTPLPITFEVCGLGLTVTSLWELSRRLGDRSLYLSSVLQVGDHVLYVI